MLSTTGGGTNVSHFDRRREQLRYQVLQWVYEHAGATCSIPVTGSQIGAALHIPYEELYRVIHYLDDRGYLGYLSAGPTVCITVKGIRYLEHEARNRRTIRS